MTLPTLANLPLRPHWPSWVQWRGLIRLHPRSMYEPGWRPTVPFGWVLRKVPDRHAFVVMPWWVFAVWHMWQYRYWYTHEPLVSLGFLRLREEGGYFSEATWTWAWWRTCEWHRLGPTPRRFIRDVPPTRWERFGWWIQHRIINDFARRIPRWA